MKFEGYPKIGRYSRPVILTEKIDGTNAQVLVDVTDDLALWETEPLVTISNWGPITGLVCGIWAGSRKQWIGLKNDNQGFARWVFEHAGELASGLGPGRHYGEWWGSGIQRGYELPKGEKRFSLFNVIRWDPQMFLRFKVEPWMRIPMHPGKSPCPVFVPPPDCCRVVPVIDVCRVLDEGTIMANLHILQAKGSYAAPGYMNPEGLVIYHTANGAIFKRTIEKDEEGKNETDTV